MEQLITNVLPFLKFIGKVTTAVGILTLIQLILYLNIGKDFENITVKVFSNPSVIDTEIYDIIEEIDLDPQNISPNYKYYLIGPEDKEMTKIMFHESDGFFNNQEMYIESEHQLEVSNSLYPQQYILIKSPTTSNIPINKMTFSLGYKKGTYHFKENMRSGKNDRVTLEVKRTVLSFLSD